MRLISVQNKVIFTVLGVVLIFSPFLFYYYPNQQRDLLIEGYHTEVSNIASTVALGVNIALTEQNFEGVQTAMEHAKADDRLIFVALVQVDTVADGASKERKIEKMPFSIYPEEFAFDANEITSDSLVITSSPITTEMLYGEVTVGFSTKAIKDRISALKQNLLYISGGISLLGLFIGMWLARSISRPIMKLRDATKQVGEGNLEISVSIKSKDEIGQLADSFNDMVRQLLVSDRQLTRQKEIIEEKNKGITDSINYAKRIQSAILPPDGIIKLYLKNSFVYYQPKDIVAGDFYWMEIIGDNVIIAVADCTGHGVPGAMVSVVCNNALNNAVREFKETEPAAILDKVNAIVTEQFATGEQEISDGMDIALVSLNTKTGQASFAGANNPLYHVSDGELHQIKGDKQPIGSFTQAKSFTGHSITLKEGDSIYLSTDGYPDQFGGTKGKKLMYKTFRQLLLDNSNKPMEDQRNNISQYFEEWRGELEQVDDVCVMGIRV